jgi:hypothetical protein
VGLKDTFGRRESTRRDFEDTLDRMEEELEVERISPAEAKRLVAGGIRFARHNGFKLPPHYERWTAIFGDLGDVAAADLTGFGVEGGLRYVGTKAFLQRRLAACTVDEFLRRPDVEWVLGDGTPRDPAEADYSLDLGEDEEEEDEDTFDPETDADDAELLADLKRALGATSDRMQDAVRQWCFQTGQAPHPRLRDALATLLVSTVPLAMVSNAAEIDPTVADTADIPHPGEIMAAGLEAMPAEDRQSVVEAIEQVEDYLRQFKTPARMLAALDGQIFEGPSLPPA